MTYARREMVDLQQWNKTLRRVLPTDAPANCSRVLLWTSSMRYTTLERAFQLAQDGPAVNLAEIRAALKAEGYSDGVVQTSFNSVRKQLRAAVDKRRRD